MSGQALSAATGRLLRLRLHPMSASAATSSTAPIEDSPPSRDSERSLGVRGLSGVTALGFLSSVIGMVASLLAFTTFARSLGPEKYGVYIGGVFGITGLMLSLTSGGIVLAMLHDLTRSETKAGDAGSFLTMSVLLALLATVVVALLGTTILPRVSRSFFIAIMLIEVVGQGVVNLVATAMHAFASFRTATMVRTFQSLVRLFAIVGMLLLGRVSLGSFIVVQAVGVAAAVCFSIVMLGRLGIRLRFRLPRMSHLWLTGQYAVGVSAFSLQNDFDKTMLARIPAFEVQAGQYTAAYRLLMLIDLVPTQMIGATHDRILRLGRLSAPAVRTRVRQLSIATLGFVAVAWLGVLVGRPIIVLLLGDDYKPAIPMLLCLIPMIVLRTVGMLSSNALVAVGGIRRRLTATLGGAALGLVAYLILIPRFGWKGAVAGTLISETFLAVALVTSLRRHMSEAHAPESRFAGPVPTVQRRRHDNHIVVVPSAGDGTALSDLSPALVSTPAAPLTITTRALTHGATSREQSEQLRQLAASAPDKLVLLAPWEAGLRFAAGNDIPTAVMVETLAAQAKASLRMTVELLNDPTVIVVGCHGWNLAARLRSFGVDATKVVAWGLDDRAGPSGTAVRTRRSDGPFTIMYSGPLHDSGGLGDLLLATAQLRDQEFDLRVMVFGGGQDRSRYETFIADFSLSDVVRFHGQVSEARLVDAAGRADVVVMPSHRDHPEGITPVLRAALLRRTPIVATDHPLHRVNLIDGESAVVVPAVNPERLAKALASVCNDEALFAKLSEGSAAAWQNLRVRTRWNDVVTSFAHAAPGQRDWLDNLIAQQRAKVSSRT